MKKKLARFIALFCSVLMVSFSFQSVSFAKEADDATAIVSAEETVQAEETVEDNDIVSEEGEVLDAEQGGDESVVIIDENEADETADEDVAEDSEADAVDEETDAEETDADVTDSEEIDSEEISSEEISSEEIDSEEVASEIIEHMDEEELLEILEEEIINATELANIKVGWNKMDNGKWRYYTTTSKYYKDTVQLINGEYYGFDSDGYMWDTEGQEKYCNGSFYRVQVNKGGSLIKDKWFSTPNLYTEGLTDWYYYGSDGKGYSGLKTVNSVQYIFRYDGMMQRDAFITEGGNSYASDEDGIAHKLTKGGWTKVGKKWYYQNSDGSFPPGYSIQKLGNSYYYFRYNGEAANDETESLSLNNNYYRAHSNATLYVNEWYQTTWGDWYWYGNEGKAPTTPGIYTIDTKNYMISSGGRLMTNSSMTVGNAPYVSDSDGVAYKIENNKWTQVGKYYYYAISNKKLTNQVKEINGSLYGFDYVGRMYDDTSFSIYDSDSGNYKSYRAKKGGKLYRSEWFESTYRYSDSDWYYYGSDGVRVSGLQTINGSKYYFNDSMYKSCYVLISDKLYQCDGNGRVTSVSGTKLFTGVKYEYLVYLENGKPLKSDWKQINGKWFYFGSNGAAYRDQTASIDGKRYYFTDDGTMATSGWFKSYSDTYYAQPNGELLTGEQKIGGKYYYFSNYGAMLKGAIVYNGKLYITNPDGTYRMTANNNAWTNVDGTYYYAKNGNFYKGQVADIDGNTYYFNSDGTMAKNEVRNRSLYGSNGARIKKSGWNSFNNEWYYLDSDYRAYQGTIETINGVQYAFDYECKMVRNANYNGIYFDESGHRTDMEKKDGWVLYGGYYYYYKNGAKVTDKWIDGYYLDSAGQMERNTITPDGYYVGNDGKYVKNQVINGVALKSDGKLASKGWIKLNGKSYYVTDDNGTVNTRNYFVVDKNLYQFDYDGVYVKTVATNVQNDTWYQATYAYTYDGHTYSETQWTYIKNGQTCTGLVDVANGDTYYFYSNGYMGEYSSYAYPNDGSGRAYCLEKGKVDKTATGWKNGYYYGADNRTSGYDWVTVNGKLYYGYSGSGSSTRSTTQYINGNIYNFNKDGSLSGQDNTQNGWKKLGVDWYYFKNGKALYDGLYEIDGKTYAFNYDGKLYKTESVVYGYHINASGCLDKTKGFKTIDGTQYYFDANGKALYGVQKINGKVYYF